MNDEKKPPNKREPENRVCIRCGERHQPEHPSDFVCPACKAKKLSEPKG
jgi:predicted RNA-binding Zn-ribbon protein involved in translation (DUF1610 family)